ncbi:MAG TPA: hypothetical protein VGA78_01045 [Gemmatimonadales bacterium]
MHPTPAGVVLQREIPAVLAEVAGPVQSARWAGRGVNGRCVVDQWRPR